MNIGALDNGNSNTEATPSDNFDGILDNVPATWSDTGTPGDNALYNAFLQRGDSASVTPPPNFPDDVSFSTLSNTGSSEDEATSPPGDDILRGGRGSTTDEDFLDFNLNLETLDFTDLRNIPEGSVGDMKILGSEGRINNESDA